MQDLRQAMSARSPELGAFRRLVFAVLCLTLSQSSVAMGLRSFVALPVEKGGHVLRIQLLRNFDANIDRTIASLAFGIDGRRTLLFGIPYRLSPGGSDQFGDLSALYRHTVWQVDAPGKTARLALLGGVVIPTNHNRDAAVQAGFEAGITRDLNGPGDTTALLSARWHF